MPYTHRAGAQAPMPMSETSTTDIDVATLDSQNNPHLLNRLSHSLNTAPQSSDGMHCQQHAHADMQQAPYPYAPPSPSEVSTPQRSGVDRTRLQREASSSPRGFIMFAAANLFGTTVNLEMPFYARPALDALTDLCKKVFAMERAVARPEGVAMEAPFNISRISVYDERTGAWDDVGDGSAIRDGCQVYVFQNEIPGVHREAMQPIPPPQLPMKAALPEVGSEAERAQAVFEEADINGRSRIDAGEFKRLLQTLHIGYPDHVAEGLFDEADAERGGSLDVAGFAGLCAMYPTLAECAYFRSRDFWEDYQLRQDLEGARGLLEVMSRECVGGQQRLASASSEVHKVSDRLQVVEGDIQGQQRNERRCEDRLQQVESELNNAEQALRDAEAEHKVCVDRTHAVHHFISSAQQDCGACEENLQSRNTVLQQSVTHERQLRQALEDAVREVERQRKLVTSSSAELKKIQSKLTKAHGDLDSLTQDAERAAARIQQLTAARDEVCEKKVETLRQLDYEQQSTQQVVSLKQGLLDKLGFVKEEEEQCARQASDASETVAKQERVVQALDGEVGATAARRQRIEEEEWPLLEQELQLKQQRESIRQQETQLRLDASGLFKSSGRSRTHRSDRSLIMTAGDRDTEREKRRSFTPGSGVWGTGSAMTALHNRSSSGKSSLKEGQAYAVGGTHLTTHAHPDAQMGRRGSSPNGDRPLVPYNI